MKECYFDRRREKVTVLLAVLLISALLLLVNKAMCFGFFLLGAAVPTRGPIRSAVHARMARRESANLDREYERLLSR